MNHDTEQKIRERICTPKSDIQSINITDSKILSESRKSNLHHRLARDKALLFIKIFGSIVARPYV